MIRLGKKELTVSVNDAPTTSTPASGYIPAPSYNADPGNGGRKSSTVRNLLIALGVVSLVAVLLPLALIFSCRDSDTSDSSEANIQQTTMMMPM